MKVLVTIANYGTVNDKYLARVLDEYRGMREDVDLVVTSNIPKDLGKDVEVIAGLPTKNPRSLPFAHKRIFADRKKNYDLFIYTEDDILITQRNIEAFLRASDVLREDENAAFFRTEVDSNSRLYFPDVHHQYHWDSTSVCQRGDYSFAFFTNEHSGCYALTKEQLRKAIASGGFLVGFHEGKHPPLESAATDPFLQCGLRKLVCISHLDQFTVPHLSNKYAGKGILPAEDFYAQIKALLDVSRNGKFKASLFPVETTLYHGHYSKVYYEPCQDQLIALVPEGSRNILSVGCGCGATEQRLIEKGMRVKAVPIDSVIAVNAEAKGVEIIRGSARTAREALANERFDCVLMSNVLHLVRDPIEFLSIFAELLAGEGILIASVPNLSMFLRLSRWLRLHGNVANPRGYDASGMHVSTGRLLRQWFQRAGLNPQKSVYEVSERGERADQLSFGLARPFVGSTAYVSGVRAGKH